MRVDSVRIHINQETGLFFTKEDSRTQASLRSSNLWAHISIIYIKIHIQECIQYIDWLILNSFTWLSWGTCVLSGSVLCLSPVWQLLLLTFVSLQKKLSAVCDIRLFSCSSLWERSLPHNCLLPNMAPRLALRTMHTILWLGKSCCFWRGLIGDKTVFRRFCDCYSDSDCFILGYCIL